MKLSLVCIGPTGAQTAEALLHCAFCGALPREDVIRVSLLAAGAEDTARVRALYAAYSELRGGWGLSRHTGLAPILTLRTDRLTGTLGELAAPEDAALLRCVLPSEEMDRPAMQASARAAAVYWACLLDRPEGVLADVLADAREMPTAVCASLADPCGGAAAEQLAPHLSAQPAAALLTSVLVHGDDAAAVRRFLDGSRIRPDFTALVGLPDDCAAQEAGPHLAHLMLVRALDAFLTGGRGEYGFRAPMALDWHALDPDGPRWGAAFDRLLRFDALWQSVFLPDSLHALEDGAMPRGRKSPWLEPYLGRVRDERARAETARQLRRAGEIAHAGACWLRAMQRSLPFVLRTSTVLNEARDQAGAHYEQVLRRAGQLALLDHDIRLTGMTPHTTIHRHDMEDTEDETALVQREAVRDALQMDIAAQQDFDLREGGRIRLNSLREIAARERGEADALRRQVAEARRVIDRAAAGAGPESLAKIDQARTRLRRMERRLASVEGRARQAAGDAASAAAQDARTRPPQLNVSLDAPSEVFWPAAWLDMLCGLPRVAEPRARVKQTQTVLGYWPWTATPAKGMADRVAGLTAPEAAPALRLIDVVLHVCAG